MVTLMLIAGLVKQPSIAWSQSTQKSSLTRSREVWTLVVYDLGEQSIGRCEPLTVSVMPETDPSTFRVGIYESEVGGTGTMWRSAAWMSTAAASLATAFAPEARHVTFDVNGKIDGPSAGAIMTIGILAAVRGDAILPDTTMTGMINPDFSIGPVGGIPHKIRGAAQAGKKLILIPAGSRFDFDRNLKKDVDLVELGRSMGVTVEPVADLFTAYRKITGTELPRWADSTDQPVLSAEIEKATIRRTKEYVVRAEHHLRLFDGCPDDAKSEEASGQANDARQWLRQANAVMGENDIVGANRLAFEANFTAASTYHSARLSDIYQKSGLEAVIKEVKEVMTPWPRIELAIGHIKEFSPRTMREASGLIDAHSCLNESIAFAILGDDLLEKRGASDDESLDFIVEAAVNYQYALIDLDGMRELLEDWRGGSALPSPEPDRVALAAQLFRRVAEANMSMFETLFVESRARAEGTSASAVRQRLMDEEGIYSHLQMNLRVLRVLENHLNQGAEYSYANLTAMRDAYVSSALLIAKHYSLQVAEETEGVTRVSKERTLQGMLEFAESQARRGIAHLKTKDIDANMPATGYLVGRLKREGTANDKLEALSYYWGSHLSSQILSILAGTTDPTSLELR
jgi:hypothetical protein